MGCNTKIIYFTQYINESIQIWHKMVQDIYDIYIYKWVKLKTEKKMCQRHREKPNALNRRKIRNYATKFLRGEFWLLYLLGKK